MEQGRGVDDIHRSESNPGPACQTITLLLADDTKLTW